jgi:ribonuclease VapC
MSEAVFDASALLALLRQEAGAERASDFLVGAAVSAVNYAEVIGRLVDLGGQPVEVAREVDRFDLDIVPFDREASVQAGALRAATRRHGLCLGDRACLALAARLGVPAVTADRAWASLDLGVEVVLIR